MAFYVQQTTQESPKVIYDSTTDVFRAADSVTMSSSGGPAEMAIFSQFAIPLEFKMGCQQKEYPDYQCAHIYFVTDHYQVMRWIPVVQSFLKQQGIQ